MADTSFGFQLAIFGGGLAFAAIGMVVLGGIVIKAKDVELQRNPLSGSDSRTQVFAGIVSALGGVALIVYGIVAPPSGDGDSSATPDPSAPTSHETTTTLADVDPVGVTIDTPQDGATTRLRCDEDDENVCWVNASGRVGSEVDTGSHVYALVASDSDGGGNPNYWIQYDSTIREGQTWTAKAYVEGVGPGDEVVLKAVVLPDAVEAPQDDDAGLLWADAWQGDPIAQTAASHVTLA